MKIDDISLYVNMGGMLLRGTLFQLLHLRWPRIFFMGKGSRIFGFRRFSFQSPMKLGNYSVIDARFSDGIRVGRNFIIGDFSVIRASGSRNFHSPGIQAGNFVSFGPYTSIGGGFGVKIGDSILGGPYCSIHPENHNFADPEITIRSQGISGAGIRIESDIWIGAKVTILDGSIVDSGAIIAAGAVLRGAYPASAIIGGIPAKVLRLRAVD